MENKNTAVIVSILAVAGALGITIFLLTRKSNKITDRINKSDKNSPPPGKVNTPVIPGTATNPVVPQDGVLAQVFGALLNGNGANGTRYDNDWDDMGGYYIQYTDKTQKYFHSNGQFAGWSDAKRKWTPAPGSK